MGVLGCLVVRLGLWRVCSGVLVSASSGVGAGCSPWRLLPFFLGGGLVDHFLWVCWGPVRSCVAADALVVLLGAYRGAGVGACASGLRLSWLFLDFLLGGFGKIQLTQIIQFAIYLHKIGNADAKCHEIQFSKEWCFFVNFLIVIFKYVFSKVIILLMLCL